MYQDLTKTWDGFTPLTQDILIIIGVVMVTWLVRQMIQPLLIRRLHRLAARTETQWDDIIIAALDTPLRYLMMALILAAGVELINLEATIGVFITHVSRTLIIVAVFLIVFQIGSYITQNPLTMRRVTSLRVDDALLPFLRTALRFLLIMLALVIVVEEWGYNVNGLIAGLGVGGLAVALAAQDTISNLFGFSMIVGDRPFVEGEYIVTSAASGTVENVGLRSTRIRQLDQSLVTIPNNSLASNPITNWSRLSKRRINTTIGLTYQTSSAQLRGLLHVLREMLQNHPLVEKDSVVVIFTHFGENSLEILVRCYLTIEDWTEFHLEQEKIFLDIMDMVQQMGLEIAFPSRTIYIEEMPELRGRLPKSTPLPVPDDTYRPVSDDLSQDEYK